MRSETIDFAAAGLLVTTGSPMGAELLIRRTIGCFPRPGTGCGLALCHARFPALSVALEGAGTGKILIVRHAVVLSSDGTRDKIGLQNGCFPTARLAQPRAAKLCWFAAVCLHQYCERNDVALPAERYPIGTQTAPNFVF